MNNSNKKVFVGSAGKAMFSMSALAALMASGINAGIATTSMLGKRIGTFNFNERRKANSKKRRDKYGVKRRARNKMAMLSRKANRQFRKR